MKHLFKTAMIAMALSASTAFGAGKEISVSVKGMVCSFCAQGITKKFSAEPAVEKVKVSLEEKTVNLTLKEGQDIPDERIENALKDAGYNVEKLKESKTEIEFMKKSVLSFISLFTSFGTLVCCALPALFVALGMGAAFAGLVSRFPQLIWLSEHKKWIFITGAIALILAGWVQWKARNQPCPIDPIQAKACQTTRKWSLITYLASAVIYLIGTAIATLSVFVFSYPLNEGIIF